MESLPIIQNGIKIIDYFTKDNVGAYKCIAFNTVMFSSTLEVNLNIASNGKNAIAKLFLETKETKEQQLYYHQLID